jgi:hypothetical protein
VLLVIVIVVIVVLAAVVFLAMGRGGELSVEPNDYAPLDLGPVSATDVALLRPPTGLWGYNMQATDEAMDQIAESIRERDVRIVALEQLVTDLSRDHAPMQLLSSPYAGARHRRALVDTAETQAAVWAPSDTVATEQAGSPFEPERAETPFELEQAETPFEPEQAGSLYEPEQARFPLELPRPSGAISGAPPEQSHD